MISHRLQSVPITGYYEYLSRIRHRVNVAPYEGGDSEDIMTQTTTTTDFPSVASVMNNDDDTASATNSLSVDNSQETLVNVNDKDVTQWSSTEVQHWLEEQCQKFELKKATTEKFQMNGQALVLLTKHDFLRRSPDGGEILYYALRRLINPDKSNSVRIGHRLTRNGSSRQHTRIIEVGSDSDEHHSATGSSSSSSKPIIEEPDDPPFHHQSDEETNPETNQQQYYPHSFLHNHSHIHQPIFTMPNAAAYYHQHQAFPNTFVYAHHHPHHRHHAHAHMHQQQFFHPQAHAHSHFIHQYYPMMTAQGILIEVLDNEEENNLTANGASSEAQEQLYLITMNGQRYVMNEEQIRQYVAQIQQQQQQQQQQHIHQHQHFHQQQQQHQQQYVYQQHQPSQENIFHTS